jgi:hypothetical protein
MLGGEDRRQVQRPRQCCPSAIRVCPTRSVVLFDPKFIGSQALPSAMTDTQDVDVICADAEHYTVDPPPFPIEDFAVLLCVKSYSRELSGLSGKSVHLGRRFLGAPASRRHRWEWAGETPAGGGPSTSQARTCRTVHLETFHLGLMPLSHARAIMRLRHSFLAGRAGLPIGATGRAPGPPGAQRSTTVLHAQEENDAVQEHAPEPAQSPAREGRRARPRRGRSAAKAQDGDAGKPSRARQHLVRLSGGNSAAASRGSGVGPCSPIVPEGTGCGRPTESLRPLGGGGGEGRDADEDRGDGVHRGVAPTRV